MNQQSELFGLELPKDESPEDDVRIVSFPIACYMDVRQKHKFDKKIKYIMRHHWPETYREEANITDLFEKLVNKEYESIKSKEEV